MEDVKMEEMYNFPALSIQKSHDQEMALEITGPRRPTPPFPSNNDV
jgi:hypothetical protein